MFIEKHRSQHVKIGGGERDRTDDLLRARQALSQLSYTPSFRILTTDQRDTLNWWA
jgi:hypothetical protein